MKKTLYYFILLFAVATWTACNDVAVGYLYTNEASYSIDTLRISLQSEENNDIPWTTSQIEQVLGTQPLYYSLVSVKSDQGEAAANNFIQHLTIIGGGRMYVAADVDSPPGTYTVSLKVENEGHSAILSDIFTFVLE